MTKTAPFRPVRKDQAKTKYAHFDSRLPFRAIFGSWVVRRSKKEISPSEDQKNGGEVIFCTSPLDPVTFR